VARSPASPPELSLGSPLSSLAGIGPKRVQALAALDLLTVGDLLMAFPSRYVDWREVKAIHEIIEGETAVVTGRLTALGERPMRGSRWRRLLTGWLQDGQGARVRVVWFNAPPHLRQRFGAASEVMLQGRISRGADGRLEIVHPEVYLPGQDPPQALQPVYRAGEQVGQRLIRSAMDRALTCADDLADTLPEEFRVQLQLPSTGQAVRYLHQPPQNADLEMLRTGATAAHRALAANELFAFELALEIDRELARTRDGIAFEDSAAADRFAVALPFELTSAQRRAIGEIRADMEQPRQMNRLLIGEVGSGKTVVALWAVINAIAHGYQAAVMTPTELLAEQHHTTFARLCESSGLRSGLLSASITAPARKHTLQWLRGGEPGVVFGTQALIQRSVEIPKLGLAVIDEQHRFGVFERARLRALGPRSDMLLLTATPIPRSLARVLLSNLDVTILDERPAGRPPVATYLVGEGELDSVWRCVRHEAAKGHRAYCILPLIESDENQDLSVIAAAEQLRDGALAGLRVGLMHGRLSSEAKDSVMRDFRDGKLQVLVSTTVIEVGIDVPEATVMVIIGAQRYGLAQLHQLRGRIGRGTQPGHCFLVVSGAPNGPARGRLKVLVEKTSGAEIAQADLEMRGPGDLFGARQAGPLPLRFAHWMRNVDTILKLRDLARQWLRRDPDLKAPASAGARQALDRFLSVNGAPPGTLTAG
jgi:ATP-dependent DNA helicase RecG